MTAHEDTTAIDDNLGHVANGDNNTVTRPWRPRADCVPTD